MDFDPTEYTRLGDVADAVSWHYESLRSYGQTGVLPTIRRGSTIYVRSDVAKALVDRAADFSCLKDLIHSALDSTPTELKEATPADA